jgi:GT2 family glycosyltransferase
MRDTIGTQLRILVVLIGFNTADRVFDAARRLSGMPQPPDVLIIENGVGDYPPGFEVIRPAKNIGYSAAANRALDEGFRRGYDVVTIANSDIELDRETFVHLRKAIAVAPDGTAVIGGVELNPSGQVVTAGGSWSRWTGTDRWHREAPSLPTLAAFAQGAFVSFLPPAARVMPLFDERLFMYFDEVQVGLTLRAADLKCLIHPGIRYVHDNASGRFQPYRGYLLHRNKALVATRFAGRTKRLAHAVGLARLLGGIAARGRSPQVAYATASLHGWLDGVRDRTSGARRYGLPL